MTIPPLPPDLDARALLVSTPIADQPPPVANDRPPIWELVIADMKDRHQLGIERYGTPLQAFNGRDALIDMYQEQLDNVAYTRQLIEERKGTREEVLAQRVRTLENALRELDAMGALGKSVHGWLRDVLRNDPDSAMLRMLNAKTYPPLAER